MTEVIIKLQVPERVYDQFEGTLMEFEEYMDALRIEMDITEKEK